MYKPTRAVSSIIASAVAFVALWLTPALVFAQPSKQWEVRSWVDKTTAKPHQVLFFHIEVSGSGQADPKLVETPSFRGFEVRQQGHERRLTSSTGQGLKFSHDFYYVIAPKESGRLVIGAATVGIGQQTFRTDPIPIEVLGQRTPAVTPPIPRPRNPTPSTTPTTPRPNPSGTQTITPVPGDDDFFLEAKVNKAQVHVGEAFFVRYDLFRKVGVASGFYNIREPEHLQLWAVDATSQNEDSRVGVGSDVRKGHRYQRELALAQILIPLEAGTRTVAPLEEEVHDGSPPGYWIASAPVSVEVLPLPSGAPAGFDSKNVGASIAVLADPPANEQNTL